MERANLSVTANPATKRLSQTLLALLTLLLSAAGCFASTITLQWDMETAESLAGYKVYYSESAAGAFIGTGATEGASPIDVAKINQAVISGLDPNRDYYFAVTAYDGAGVESPFSNIVRVPELAPPSVSITSPAAGSQVSGTVSISASASDNVGVASVRFYVNGALAYTSNEAPHLFSWQTSALPSGDYSITAEAVDAAENVGKSGELALHLVDDAEAPVISSITPGNGATLSGTVAVTAGATDNLGVSRIELYQNGTLVFVGNDNPVSYNWNTAAAANGSYVLSAKAYDAVGNESLPVGTTVNVHNDASAPTVTAFSLPAISNSLSVPVLAFGCSDDVGVAGYLLSESAAAPAASDPRWSASAPASFTFAGAGSRTLYAWARDAAGHVSAGRVASVQIDTVPPTISSLSLATGSSSVTIKAVGSDSVALAKMELYVDDAVQMETSASSFTYVWNAGARKSQTITIKVHDTAGNVRSQSFRVAKI